MGLSRKTEAALIRALVPLGHSEIGLLFYEYSLEPYDSGGNRLDRSRSLIAAVHNVHQESGEADKVLLELAERQVRSYPERYLSVNPDAAALVRALELDGYSFVDGRLIPTTPAPAALGPQISNLEKQLEELALKVALTHYEQAAENFVKGNYEAANGQVRSFAEGLFIDLCKQRCGKAFDDASAALQHMRDRGWLDVAEWNHFRSFWANIQDNGPHHGLSSEEEALFRLHSATALARYLLSKAAT